MNKLYFTLIASIGAVSALAQTSDYATTLRLAGSGNRSLKASEALMSAEQKENMTGLNLADPEVGFSYQWGNPAGVPDKKTIDLTQSFDFGVISGGRRRVAAAKNNAAAFGYDADRLRTMEEIDALMTEIVYRTRLDAWYDNAIRHLEQMRVALEKSVEKGNISRIDANSVKIEERIFISEGHINAIELKNLKSSLSRLAGGQEINWDAAEYADFSLPADFEAWSKTLAASDPLLALAKANVDIADREVSLRKSESLPGFSLGYTSEIVKDANYYGVSIGLSLPLWNNAGRVKAARLAQNAAKIAQEDAAFNYTAQLKERYAKARELQKLVRETKQLRDDCDIRVSLTKMLDAGRISVHEYLAQVFTLYELDKKVLEADRDYQLALVALRQGRL